MGSKVSKSSHVNHQLGGVCCSLERSSIEGNTYYSKSKGSVVASEKACLDTGCTERDCIYNQCSMCSKMSKTKKQSDDKNVTKRSTTDNNDEKINASVLSKESESLHEKVLEILNDSKSNGCATPHVLVRSGRRSGIEMVDKGNLRNYLDIKDEDDDESEKQIVAASSKKNVWAIGEESTDEEEFAKETPMRLNATNEASTLFSLTDNDGGMSSMLGIFEEDNKRKKAPEDKGQSAVAARGGRGKKGKKGKGRAESSDSDKEENEGGMSAEDLAKKAIEEEEEEERKAREKEQQEKEKEQEKVEKSEDKNKDDSDDDPQDDGPDNQLTKENGFTTLKQRGEVKESDSKQKRTTADNTEAKIRRLTIIELINKINPKTTPVIVKVNRKCCADCAVHTPIIMKLTTKFPDFPFVLVEFLIDSPESSSAAISIIMDGQVIDRQDGIEPEDYSRAFDHFTSKIPKKR